MTKTVSTLGGAMMLALTCGVGCSGDDSSPADTSPAAGGGGSAGTSASAGQAGAGGTALAGSAGTGVAGKAGSAGTGAGGTGGSGGSAGTGAAGGGAAGMGGSGGSAGTGGAGKAGASGKGGSSGVSGSAGTSGTSGSGGVSGTGGSGTGGACLGGSGGKGGQPPGNACSGLGKCCSAIADANEQATCMKAVVAGDTLGCAATYQAYASTAGALGCTGTVPAPLPCDIVTDTGCGPCQKCGVGSVCWAAGPVPLGGSCKQLSVGGDDCAAGVCTGIGVPDFDYDATTPHQTCQSVCTATTCPNGQRCIGSNVVGTAAGVCVTPCQEFDPTSCPTDQVCATGGGALPDHKPVLWCNTTGPLKDGDICASSSQCMAPLTCQGSRCSNLCDETHTCPSTAKSPSTCRSYFIPNSIPYCFAANGYAYEIDCAGLTPDATVAMSSTGFSPAATPLSWKKGASPVVRFDNADSVPHSATEGLMGVYDSTQNDVARLSVIVPAGGSACVSFDTLTATGAPLSYFDVYAPTNTGTVTVCRASGAVCMTAKECCSGACAGTCK